ncbi:MAG: hypothetical protein DRQ51_02195 [Gammaproteobacteria bacterium]|nr:MAG: hypothetical protein DRQ51_02195 [Gammaproteobacteria bacterium]
MWQSPNGKRTLSRDHFVATAPRDDENPLAVSLKESVTASERGETWQSLVVICTPSRDCFVPRNDGESVITRRTGKKRGTRDNKPPWLSHWVVDMLFVTG